LAKVALFFASFLFRQKKERRNAMADNTDSAKKQCGETVKNTRAKNYLKQD